MNFFAAVLLEISSCVGLLFINCTIPFAFRHIHLYLIILDDAVKVWAAPFFMASDLFILTLLRGVRREVSSR